MQLTHPAWLLLIGVVPWIIATARSSRVSPAVVMVRVSLVTCLVLACAGLEVGVSDGSSSVVFAVDRSDSIASREQSQSLRRVATLAAGMRDQDRAALVVFGTDAVIDQRLAPGPPAPKVGSPVNGGGTNLETALRVARAALPPDGLRRIVLLSDGHETDGDALREASLAAADGIRVDVVSVSSPAAHMRIGGVTAPEQVRVGEPYGVVAEVLGAPRGTETISIERDGRVLTTAQVTLDPSGTARVGIEERQTVTGSAAYTATVSGGATDVPPVADTGAVVVAEGAATVLYVTRGDSSIADVLASGQFHITRILPESLPTAVAELAPFAAVILDEVPAEMLNEPQNRALSAFVEQHGGGLLVVGSSASLGPSGYPGTLLGAALPVDLRKRNGTRAPDVALVIVFDKSGSMADAGTGISKIELARRAVLGVLQVVPPTDPIGVIAFDTAPTVIAPLSTSHTAGTLMDALRRIEPGGATQIAPAMETARDWLRASAVTRRQILLLSDGRSAPADEARLMELARARDVGWSIVAIGPDVDRGLIERLAHESAGRAYFPENVNMLPDIVAREAARATGGWRVQQRFVPRVLLPHPVLTGIDGASIPALDGYAASVARPTAGVIFGSPLGDPILSAWRFGLGRVAVFNAGMGPAFRGWTGFAPLWRQTARWIGRSHDSAARIRTDINSRRGEAVLGVEVRTAAGGYMNALDGEAAVRGPDGRITAIALRQTEPGRYEAHLSTPERGPYLASISMREPASGESFSALRGSFLGGAREHPGENADIERLTQIAHAGGGALLAETDDPFSGARPRAYRDASTALALIALVMFLADVALRRGITPTLMRDAWRRRTTAD
jgi:Ca-activated chloride channel homolog